MTFPVRHASGGYTGMKLRATALGYVIKQQVHIKHMYIFYTHV